jgi:hypothetical protein
MIAAEGYGGQVGPAFSGFSALPAFAAITKALVSRISSTETPPGGAEKRRARAVARS